MFEKLILFGLFEMIQKKKKVKTVSPVWVWPLGQVGYGGASRHICYMGSHVSVLYYTVPSGTYCAASLSFIVSGLYRQTFI